jgi:protoporphyrinogen oxidase
MARRLRIGIVGAGFAGLAARYALGQKGHVDIYEKGNCPGGLAEGFSDKKWSWSLEQHYHHWFTNDYHILNLAKEVGQKVIIKRPKTSVFYNRTSFQFDNPTSLLSFPYLSLSDKIRTGVTLAALKMNPFWKPLEKLTAMEFIQKTMGNKSWQVIWKPLFGGKFGKDAECIAASWFWLESKKGHLLCATLKEC